MSKPQWPPVQICFYLFRRARTFLSPGKLLSSHTRLSLPVHSSDICLDRDLEFLLCSSDLCKTVCLLKRGLHHQQIPSPRRSGATMTRLRVRFTSTWMAGYKAFLSERYSGDHISTAGFLPGNSGLLFSKKLIIFWVLAVHTNLLA